MSNAFQHILVPVDGSGASAQAVQKAASLAKAFQSQVTLICVIDSYAFTGVGSDLAYGRNEYLSAATAEAQQAVSAAQKEFAEQGIQAATLVADGQVIYKSILDAALSCEADLIVMGSHGRKGLEKLVLGSVTAQVLSHTHLPVMIVRE
ncbi:MAG: universal stress protein [Pseudomonadota bacterium]